MSGHTRSSLEVSWLNLQKRKGCHHAATATATATATAHALVAARTHTRSSRASPDHRRTGSRRRFETERWGGGVRPRRGRATRESRIGSCRDETTGEEMVAAGAARSAAGAARRRAGAPSGSWSGVCCQVRGRRSRVRVKGFNCCSSSVVRMLLLSLVIMPQKTARFSRTPGAARGMGVNASPRQRVKVCFVVPAHTHTHMHLGRLNGRGRHGGRRPGNVIRPGVCSSAPTFCKLLLLPPAAARTRSLSAAVGGDMCLCVMRGLKHGPYRVVVTSPRGGQCRAGGQAGSSSSG